MISKRLFIAAAAGTLFAVSAQAAGPEPVSMFGTPLKNAQRTDLRKAIERAGVKAKRTDDKYWADLYDATGLLDEAKDLHINYTRDGKFASAIYRFPSHVDAGQIRRVVDLVSRKYGRPSKVNGRYDLGDADATWNMPQGMKIIVARAWPDTTTYMQIEDTATHKQMKNEQAAVDEANRQQRDKAQSNAF